MTLTIQKRLVDLLEPQAGAVVVSDVRIGLGYTAVQLQSGHAGVAWTAKSDSACCTHFKEAGTLTGRPAGELLRMLANESSAIARPSALPRRMPARLTAVSAHHGTKSLTLGIRRKTAWL
jgi:uncharacterized protein (DUF4213/DUF364 family)